MDIILERIDRQVQNKPSTSMQYGIKKRGEEIYARSFVAYDGRTFGIEGDALSRVYRKCEECTDFSILDKYIIEKFGLTGECNWRLLNNRDEILMDSIDEKRHNLPTYSLDQVNGWEGDKICYYLCDQNKIVFTRSKKNVQWKNKGNTRAIVALTRSNNITEEDINIVKNYSSGDDKKIWLWIVLFGE